MSEENQCPICFTPCKINSHPEFIVTVNCPRCGFFNIHRLAFRNFYYGSYSERERAIASSIIRSGYGYKSTINTNDEYKLFKSKDVPVTDKADILLLLLSKLCNYVGQYVEITSKDLPETLARTWILNVEELKGFVRFLQDLSCLLELPVYEKKFEFHVKIIILPDGWRRIEKLERHYTETSQCFVAMWFHESMDEIYKNYIYPSIIESGYDPQRIDNKEHTNIIEDEIIKEIRRSKFVIADMTGDRGSVYYEVGFAHGLGLDVIITAQKYTKISFDLNHYNCIFWEYDKLDEFKRNLLNRIEVKFGQGPKVSIK